MFNGSRGFEFAPSYSNSNNDNSGKSEEEKKEEKKEEETVNLTAVTTTTTTTVTATSNSTPTKAVSNKQKTGYSNAVVSNRDGSFADVAAIDWIVHEPHNRDDFREKHKECIVAPDTLALPEREGERRVRRAITYRCVNRKSKRVDNPSPRQAEEALMDDRYIHCTQ